MASKTRENLQMLFRQRPTLAAEILRDIFHREVPSFTRARTVDLALAAMAGSASEMAVLYENEQAAFAVVIVAQPERDPEKRCLWLPLLAGVRALYRCPISLLVVTMAPEMVGWCEEPLDSGHPGFVLTPLVLGPDKVPVVTDPEQARAVPELSVLSAMAHGRSDAGGAIAWAYLVSIGRIPPTPPFEERMAAMMKAEEAISVLEARGLEVPADVRDRVLGTTDLAKLDLWIRRAAVVSEARELFATPAS